MGGGGGGQKSSLMHVAQISSKDITLCFEHISVVSILVVRTDKLTYYSKNIFIKFIHVLKYSRKIIIKHRKTKQTNNQTTTNKQQQSAKIYRGLPSDSTTGD